jgi:hypothetical protein
MKTEFEDSRIPIDDDNLKNNHTKKNLYYRFHSIPHTSIKILKCSYHKDGVNYNAQSQENERTYMCVSGIDFASSYHFR